MRLAVFGATGKTGQHLLREALAAGHEVTALVLSPDKLASANDRLLVIAGDALSEADVVRTVRAADAVISLIGPTKGGPKDVASRSTALMLSAMARHDVERIIVASVGGVPTPDDRRGPVARAAGALIKLLLGELYVDRERQLALLRESDRAWIALRLPRLTDDAPTGAYRLGYEIKPTYAVARADVARALLDLLEDETYRGHAPIIQS